MPILKLKTSPICSITFFLSILQATANSRHKTQNNPPMYEFTFTSTPSPPTQSFIFWTISLFLFNLLQIFSTKKTTAIWGLQNSQITAAYLSLMTNQKQDYPPTEPGYKAASISNSDYFWFCNPFTFSKRVRLVPHQKQHQSKL